MDQPDRDGCRLSEPSIELRTGIQKYIEKRGTGAKIMHDGPCAESICTPESPKANSDG